MIEITVVQEDLDKIIDKLKGVSVKNRNSALYASFKKASLLLERRLKENSSGRFLKVRSGHLYKSIGSVVSSSDKNIKAEIGSGVRQGKRVSYADILETGGVIKPSKGKYLTIPIGEALTAAGVPRFTAAEVRDGKTKFKSSFIAKGIIFGKTGKKGIVPLFILKTSVTIPAKYWMSKTAQEGTKEVVVEILRAIDEELKK
jgi:hypothetical protein